MMEPTPLELLRAELVTAKAKLSELQRWLVTHTSHPDFIKIAGDRNHMSVKVDGLKFKILQLERGLPLLGIPDEPEHSVSLSLIDLEKFHNSIR